MTNKLSGDVSNTSVDLKYSGSFSCISTKCVIQNMTRRNVESSDLRWVQVGHEDTESELQMSKSQRRVGTKVCNVGLTAE